MLLLYPAEAKVVRYHKQTLNRSNSSQLEEHLVSPRKLCGQEAALRNCNEVVEIAHPISREASRGPEQSLIRPLATLSRMSAHDENRISFTNPHL